MNLCKPASCPAGVPKKSLGIGEVGLFPSKTWRHYPLSARANQKKGPSFQSAICGYPSFPAEWEIVMVNRNKKSKLHRGTQESKIILSPPILILLLHTIKALFQYGFNFIALGLDPTLLYTALPNRAAPLVNYIYANVLACSDNYHSP